jgi:hypothetical protein
MEETTLKCYLNHAEKSSRRINFPVFLFAGELGQIGP